MDVIESDYYQTLYTNSRAKFDAYSNLSLYMYIYFVSYKRKRIVLLTFCFQRFNDLKTLCFDLLSIS